MTAVARIDVERLAKICSLFSSDVMGERAAAAHKANQIVTAAGLSWQEVFQPVSPTYRPTDPRPRAMTPGEVLARHGDRLTDWETRFLVSLMRWRKGWTPKQRARFEEIRERFVESGR